MTSALDVTPAPRGLSRSDWMWLGLSALAVVVSVLKAPSFPINDPALFEYFGRQMLHGQRLYADLLDVKPPSIFVVNALWQRLFGDDYALHTYAEATVNAGAIVLFALMLRRWKIEAWALGTFLFAAFFSLPFPQFDYTQHYAVFFIVLGLYLSACSRNVWAGAALALATTFWFPAALTALPILLQPIARRERLLLVSGFAGMLALYLVVLLVFFGPRLFSDFERLWGMRVGRYGFDLIDLRRTINLSALAPAIGVLLLLLLMVVRRPLAPASRFALIWSACALAGTAIPPDFFEHYFLPSVPALVMAIASFGPTFRDVMRRPIIAAAALLLLYNDAQRIVANTDKFERQAETIVVLGEWIRSSIGGGATIYTYEYLPELDLVASAVMPGRSSLLDFTGERFNWPHFPQVIVFGPHTPLPHIVEARKPIVARGRKRTVKYVPVCTDSTAIFLVYSIPSLAASFHCRNGTLVFGKKS